jgi:hypothetical protein
MDFDWKRVNEIPQILGAEETDRAVKKAYEEVAQEFDQSDWIVFLYGRRKEWTLYQDKGGHCLFDFKRGEAEEIACRVVRRVFREGTSEEQQALLRDELDPLREKTTSYQRGGRVVKIFGVFFPSELRSLIPSKRVDVSNPQPHGTVGTINIDQAKAFLEARVRMGIVANSSIAYLGLNGHT